MIPYIILAVCILLNALIGVLFKIFEQYNIRIFQAITINYLVCVLMAGLYMQRIPVDQTLFYATWSKYALFMGPLFIVVFNLMAKSVAYFGVMTATIFQKMSLIAPAIIAIVLYDENISTLKSIGLICAIAAIYYMTREKKNINTPNAITGQPISLILIPIGLFLGSCIIDSTLFIVEQEGLAPSGDASFTAGLFFIAGSLGAFVMLYQRLRYAITLSIESIIAGVVLGIPNFFSIQLIIESLQAGLDGSIVFPVNNVGVLSIASLIGIFVFKENTTRTKLIGLFLSLLAILLISFF